VTPRVAGSKKPSGMRSVDDMLAAANVGGVKPATKRQPSAFEQRNAGAFNSSIMKTR
jgi:hypothetical protein